MQICSGTPQACASKYYNGSFKGKIGISDSTAEKLSGEYEHRF